MWCRSSLAQDLLSARAWRYTLVARRCLHALALWLSLVGLAAAEGSQSPWPVPGEGVLANDPSVVWGRLPNGLRYAIRPGGSPEDHVSLRLLVEAGSLMESEQQRGLAHFLEHMAFEGSQHLAPGELIAFLQRAGLAFGPDTNASTGFDRTVYQLDLPKDDAQLVDDGLGILSEFAGRLTLPADQIESERGVILSEKRARDTPGQRSAEAMLGFLLPGTGYAERQPIGLEPVIRTAPRDQFSAFYREWYRPDRQIVVVTGDVHVEVLTGRAREGIEGVRRLLPKLAQNELGSGLRKKPGVTELVETFVGDATDFATDSNSTSTLGR